MRCTGGSARFHLVDIRLCDAVFLGFEQRRRSPLTIEPLVVATPHHRSSGLGNQLRQDYVVVGIGRFLVADRRQADASVV
jgi:hypothetical protein